MPVDVVMPRLSDTMEEGTLLRWLKKPGDSIDKGESIAEVETDKATMEVESFEQGTLGEILVQEGESAPVGEPIALLLKAGESAESAEVTQKAKPETLKQQASTKTVPVETEQPPEKAQGEQTQPKKTKPAQKKDERQEAKPEAGVQAAAEVTHEEGIEQVPAYGGGGNRLANLQEGALKQPPGEEVLPPSKRREKHMLEGAEEEPAQPLKQGKEEPPSPTAARMKVSPRAKSLAEAHGIDLAALQGSGPEGRIVATDVEKMVAKKQEGKPAAPQKTEEQQPLSKMRQTIARRMTQSKQQIPHFYVTVDVRADQMVRLRAELKAQFKISYNDLILKACALALYRHPRLNASFQEDQVFMNESINIAQAVAVPDGLMTPVLHEVDQLSLESIAEQSAALVARTRANQLNERDLTGGTFTVSNMGMYGVEDFSAIINPPQAAILAVSAIRRTPVIEGGMVIPGYQMKLTLSADHRVLNGMEAAEFLQTLKHVLENPVLLSEAEQFAPSASEGA